MDHAWLVEDVTDAQVRGFIRETFGIATAFTFGKVRVKRLARGEEDSFPQRRGNPRHVWRMEDENERVALLFFVARDNQYRVNLIQIVSDPRFPLMARLVDILVRKHFPGVEPWVGGKNTGLLMHMNGDVVSVRWGAPVLPCNVWLEEQIALGGDTEKLHEEWRERYLLDRSCYPVEEKRSYSAAVAGCRNRLRKREESHGRPGHMGTV